MSLAIVHSRATLGIEAPAVTVEVHLSRGLPGFTLVGLPEASVRESKERVRSALLNNQYEYPLKRITVNLAPAELPKEGGRFDLPIALGILAASGQIPADTLQNYECLGELALGGELRPVRGVLPAAVASVKRDRTLLLPEENLREATLIRNCKAIGVSHLQEICHHLQGHALLPVTVAEKLPPALREVRCADLSEVKGQHRAKRALIVAAAGRHNLLMLGPPGTGKTMLAERLAGILPPMTDEEALSSAVIQSVTRHVLDQASWHQRPFRSPHHTASAAALVGGGTTPRPGEISLAHHGVLFLDELPEFAPRALEALREPMERGRITIARASGTIEFPAQFQMVAAMNPCPCGRLGDPHKACRCSEEQIRKYRQRISAPMLDRIDMHIEIPNLPLGALTARASPSALDVTSAGARTIVHRARERQLTRGGKINANFTPVDVERYCVLNEESKRLIRRSQERGMSVRAYHRILKMARTIADLTSDDAISTEHLSEAISYRMAMGLA